MSLSIVRDEPVPTRRVMGRREPMRVGRLTAPGLSTADLARLRAEAGRGMVAELCATSCVFVCFFGGTSHIALWDRKPDTPAEIRGESRAIDTAIPWIRVCEHLPLLARRPDLLRLLRSMTHHMPVHGPACRRHLLRPAASRHPGHRPGDARGPVVGRRAGPVVRQEGSRPAAVDRHTLALVVRRPDRWPHGRGVPSVRDQGRSESPRIPGAGSRSPGGRAPARGRRPPRAARQPPSGLRGSHRAVAATSRRSAAKITYLGPWPGPALESPARVGEIDRSHLGSINFGLSERPKHRSASRTDSTSVASARKASETVTPRFTGPWNPSAGSGCVGLLPRRLPPCGGRNRPRCSAAPGPAEYLPTIIEPCCSPGAKEGSGRPRPRPWPARLVGCGLRSGSGVAVLRQEVRPQGDAESEAEEDADRPEHHPAQ